MSEYMPRLLNDYNSRIKAILSKDLHISNSMSIPKLLKISINIGFGEARLNENQFKASIEELSNIAGQKAVITKAKKAISNFKIREIDPVGVKVTLRASKMYEFLDRFISIASPRIRDFRGLSSKGFDKNGNYTFGIKEHIIFPEVNFDKVEKIRGLDITIVIKSIKKEDSFGLLKKLNFPFRDMRNN